MARDPRVTYHRHETNLGLVGNFSYALEHVDTPYFSILSNDDMLLPRFHETGLKVLESDPEAAFVSTQVVHVDDRMRVIRLLYPWHENPGVYEPPNGLLKLVEWAPPAWAGILFRSSLVKRFGNLDRATETLMDNDFQLRIGAQCRYVVDGTLGAVFSHRAQSISGEARLAATWPAWKVMTDKLAANDAIPPNARDESVRILNRQLVIRLYGIGVINSRSGNLEDALKAADLLVSELGEHEKARRVRRLASIFERRRWLARLHGRAAELRQPYVRKGWRRQPVTLLDYARQAGDTETLRGLEATLRGELHRSTGLR